MDRAPGRGWRRHLSYANAMSILAIFLALAGGTALAAGLRKNSVDSRAVRNNSLTSADLADRKGVRGADVADGSLTGADLADGSLTGADVADGALTGANLADGSLTGADLTPGAVGAAKLAPGAVASTAVVDNSVQGADLGPNALSGAADGVHSLDESTFGTVPDANRMFGRTSSGYVSSFLYEERSGREPGTLLADGTRLIAIGCLPGDIVISGGVTATSDPLIESRRQDNVWIARSNAFGSSGGDFEARVVCARQL